ncbi:hypothetical protein B0H11DRAFT_1924814 [Mycena galericulata]|nr:hypothetical protein B0H11DRAFT_1924814 [Mycena galericulata]
MPNDWEARAKKMKGYKASTLPIPGADEILTKPPFSRRLRARMLAKRGEWRKGDITLERFLAKSRSEQRERKERLKMKEAAARAEARVRTESKTKYLRRAILLERLQEMRARVEDAEGNSSEPSDSSCATRDLEDEVRRREAAGREWRGFVRAY